MSRIRSKGNKTTEMRFITLLRKAGIRGWRRHFNLEGKPDFVFPKRRAAVFVDGDFWHGNPRNFRMPTSNPEYWEQKIIRNRKRDKLVNGMLRGKGWTVVRVWESQLKRHQTKIIQKVLGALGQLNDYRA